MASDTIATLGIVNVRPVKELHEHLRCEPRIEFAVALVAAGQTQALLADDFGVARREALAHAVELSAGASTVPSGTHDLRRERQMTWTHPEREVATLAMGRVVHHQALCPEQEPLGLVSVVGPRGFPVLFIATGAGKRQQFHLALLRESAPTLRFKTYPLTDVRGLASDDRGLRRFSDRLIDYPILVPVSEILAAPARAA